MNVTWGSSGIAKRNVSRNLDNAVHLTRPAKPLNFEASLSASGKLKTFQNFIFLNVKILLSAPAAPHSPVCGLILTLVPSF